MLQHFQVLLTTTTEKLRDKCVPVCPGFLSNGKILVGTQKLAPNTYAHREVNPIFWVNTGDVCCLAGRVTDLRKKQFLAVVSLFHDGFFSLVHHVVSWILAGVCWLV